MSETKPLSHIASTLTLNSYQQEEFSRISTLYTKVYNQLLGKWYRFAATKESDRIDGQDLKHIDRSLRQLQEQPWLSSPEDKSIALFASNELCRHLKEREQHGLPPPHPELAPMTKFNDEVVFYWGFDIKVKEHTVRVPVLGKATTGRFRYFSGSIKAIGVRSEGESMQCVIYYRENSEGRQDKAAEKPGGTWCVGPDPIPQSPLNQRLRSAGIGFMI